MEKESGNRTSSEQTRRALVRAALKLFGEKGYEAASTRDIAREAGANIGSIAYHFGGKDGLRLACAEHIVETVRTLAEPVLLSSPHIEDRRQLQQVLKTMGGFMVAHPEAGLLVQFILRELARPSPALDVIYRGVFEPVHRRLCEVWASLTGEDPESETTRLIVFTMIGQLVYFRIGREAVLRRMGWKHVGEAELAMITATISANIDAILAAHIRSKGEMS